MISDRFLGHVEPSGLRVIGFLASFPGAFAQNTAGFHPPAELQAALPVMPVRSAAPLRQFKPAVPVLPLAPTRSLPRLLTEELECTRCKPEPESHFCAFVTFPALQVLLDQSTKANSPLKGHERTVQYLQRLGKDRQLQPPPHGCSEV